MFGSTANPVTVRPSSYTCLKSKAIGKPVDGWYTGRMGDVEFCQRLSLDPGQRNGDNIFREWTKRMVAAIRQHDQTHLITMGMLPFPGAYKAAAEQLDFVSPHLYPKTGKVDEEIELLKQFDWGKPIVIGETFPLSCGADNEREFLLKSRDFAHGWMGQPIFASTVQDNLSHMRCGRFDGRCKATQ